MGTSEETCAFPSRGPWANRNAGHAMQLSQLHISVWHAGAIKTMSGFSRLWCFHRYTSWVDHSWEEPQYNNRKENTCSDDPNDSSQKRSKSYWEDSKENRRYVEVLVSEQADWHSCIFSITDTSQNLMHRLLHCVYPTSNIHRPSQQKNGGSGGASFPFQTISR